MKKILLSLLCVTLLTACQESLEDRCEREAKEYTKKHCPALIAKNVILEEMAFDKSTHTIIYIYTLKGELNNLEVIKASEPRKRLLEQIKSSTNLKLYKDAGYNFRYVYYSTKLFDATFRKSDYDKH